MYVDCKELEQKM